MTFRPTPVALLLTASLLVGCAPADDAVSDDVVTDDSVIEDTATEDTATEDTATEDTDSEGPWAPVEGTYTLGTPIINPNGCGMSESNAPAEAYVADVDTIGRSVSIAFPNEDPTTCLYEEDGSFVCSVSTTSVDMTPVGISAVVRTVQDMAGSFSDDDRLRLSVSFESTCISGSCSTVELVLDVDFPCTTEYAVNASLVVD